jgi:hypothetical protein
MLQKYENKMTDLQIFRYSTSFYLGVLILVDKTNHCCGKRAEVPTSLLPKTATANDSEAAIFACHQQSVALSPESSLHVTLPVLLNLPAIITYTFHVPHNPAICLVNSSF